MKKHFLLIALWCSALCINAQSPSEFPFCPLDTNFTTQQIIIPGGPLKYDILCTADSTGYLSTTDAFAKLKNNFQSTLFVYDSPSSNTEGTLFVTQNINVKSTALGDGGGVIQMKVKKNESGNWVPVAQTVNGKQVYYRIVDFSPVGGSIYQKSLIQRGFSANRIAVTEDSITLESNTELSKGFSDVSDYTIPSSNGAASNQVIPRYQNMGWAVDIDINTANMKASRKWYGFGRGFYTDILDLDATRVLLVTGTEPSVIMMAERLGGTTSRDYKIYCYRQKPTESDGEWLLLNELDIDDKPVPLSIEDLVNIHKKALEAGATMFNNLSKIAPLKIYELGSEKVSKVYITETGSDNSGDLFSNSSKKYNGTLAHHLQELDAEDGTIDGIVYDPYGRILELDLATLKISPFIEGGPADNCRFHFSNPGGIGLHTIKDNNSNTKSYLVIHENIAGVNKYRNPAHVGSEENKINETYVFDLSSAPSRDNLKLFAIGPKGSEITGFSRAWSPSQDDGNIVFVTLKYPSQHNQAPFNKSMVLAISGLFEYFQNPTSCDAVANDCQPIPSSVDPQYTSGIGANIFKAWPNPVRRTLHLNEATNVSVYDHSGKLVLTGNDTNEVDLIGFKPGIYFIKNEEGQSIKLIVE